LPRIREIFPDRESGERTANQRRGNQKPPNENVTSRIWVCAETATISRSTRFTGNRSSEPIDRADEPKPPRSIRNAHTGRPGETHKGSVLVFSDHGKRPTPFEAARMAS
jgi:hypothetical protein